MGVELEQAGRCGEDRQVVQLTGERTKQEPCQGSAGFGVWSVWMLGCEKGANDVLRVVNAGECR